MAGFFGKIPAHGDFVTRDLARGFLDVWDTWLQSCIADSKARLGDAWLNVYLTSPIWRFALGANVCGAGGWAGILMPSVDRVGRYFPLTIATPLPEGANVLRLPAQADAWFEALESIALHALDDDRFDANAMRDAVAAQGEPALEAEPVEAFPIGSSAWSLAVLGPTGPAIPAALAHALIARAAPDYSLWWTAGTPAAASLAVTKLPEPANFVDLLHGMQPTDGALAAAAGGPREAASS